MQEHRGKVGNLMVTNYRTTKPKVELYSRTSNYHDQKTTFNILSGPGSRQYANIDLKNDRILYIELERNGLKIEFPYSVEDQLALWELLYDIWQKPEKKIFYAQRFLRLIFDKLVQGKLHNFAKPFLRELENQN